MRKDSIRRQSVRERGEREENHNVLLLAVPLAGWSAYLPYSYDRTDFHSHSSFSLLLFCAAGDNENGQRGGGASVPPSTHTGMSKVSKRLTYDRRKVEGMIANGNEK